MFDFEKLEVYQKAKSFNNGVLKYIASTPDLSRTAKDQLQRASLSIALNIAEALVGSVGQTGRIFS
jgi:four helix bundle protein